MALTAAQIVTLACQVAKVPAFILQAQMLLNSILSDLCQTYDFDIARGVTTFPLGAGYGNPFILDISVLDGEDVLGGNTPFGSGPYPLPADYLRCDPEDVFFTLLGVKYVLIPLDLSEFDALVQQPGIANYPDSYATDLSLQFSAVPVMYVWPPSSGAYPLTVRYRRQMPDIDFSGTATDTSKQPPWFPNTSYLQTRLAGELMRITDDDRCMSFLGEEPSGAQGILDRYLKMANDKSDRAVSVKLDRRRFGNNFSRLANTKLIGW